MKLIAIIEKGKDGYGIYVTNLIDHGLTGMGKTVEAAKSDMYEALQLLVSIYTDEGNAVPDELDNPEFVFKYDIPSFFEDFDCIKISKIAAKAGINESLVRQYKNKLAFASEEQTNKIKDAVHELGKELLAVEFK
ncbi:type II toxin-antitoxin system HicB family antitoxin [Dysgonomonas macrotermitis]|uniref:Predicted nuclease of the RNAse H fold, HicB family n=1 Tax=Dysgonomonas macrotermitis TaxID=1346286 RepID=A0A1M4UKR3_9BACT|nr:type II toxin-antitoxin system HicB family antitoxin [Dysgonomonas macrotermitis]SHE57170.1 Predicted nuclease of the RNAse H fold, HicB family [Dysgonomonas macrotermitis]